MADERIKHLFYRYVSGTCTPAEKQELAVLGLMPENQPVIDVLVKEHWEQTGLDETMPEEKGSLILASILGKRLTTEKMKPATIIRLHWRKLAVAASILLIIGSGSYFLFFNNPNQESEVVKTEAATDVEAPKITKATITLADGRTVSIDSITSGMLAQQSNVTVTKTADGNILYSESSKASPLAGGGDLEVAYNTLSNPRGSKVIDMALADDSHIWLNAGSSVTFPVAFKGNERKISITGEAYFEVTHDETKPFYVRKGDVQVQVLGTHFNVSAYDDEPEIKVTLLEGSIKVNKGDANKLLKPGQQAQIANDSSASPGQVVKVINNIDPEAVMAWKNGLFNFKNADVQSVMREISRWYDLNVSYEGIVPDILTTGKAPRSISLATMLKILELSEIKYDLNQKQITIRPK